MRPLALLLALALPASPLGVKVKKGSAVRLLERPAWSARGDVPSGAESTVLREGPGPGSGAELWRVRPGWSWKAPARAQDVVVVVVSGSLEARAGTLSKTLGPGGTAIFPAGTPFELRSRTWLRRTTFVLAASQPE